MTATDLWSLVILSVVRPAEAAQRVMALSLPRPVLWSGLLLAAALNAILFSLSDMLLPTPPMFPAILHSPLVYFALVVLGMVGFIQAVLWVGRGLGGQGDAGDVMAVIVWMQYLRLLVQAASLVLVLTIPILSLILVIAASFVGLFILLHFVMQAHRLDNLGRAAFILVLSALAVIFAATFFFALFGPSIMGPMHNV